MLNIAEETHGNRIHIYIYNVKYSHHCKQDTMKLRMTLFIDRGWIMYNKATYYPSFFFPSSCSHFGA
jgi:hypothetical protein